MRLEPQVWHLFRSFFSVQVKQVEWHDSGTVQNPSLITYPSGHSLTQDLFAGLTKLGEQSFTHLSSVKFL